MPVCLDHGDSSRQVEKPLTPARGMGGRAALEANMPDKNGSQAVVDVIAREEIQRLRANWRKYDMAGGKKPVKQYTGTRVVVIKGRVVVPSDLVEITAARD